MVLDTTVNNDNDCMSQLLSCDPIYPKLVGMANSYDNYKLSLQQNIKNYHSTQDAATIEFLKETRQNIIIKKRKIKRKKRCLSPPKNIMTVTQSDNVRHT